MANEVLRTTDRSRIIRMERDRYKVKTRCKIVAKSQNGSEGLVGRSTSLVAELDWAGRGAIVNFTFLAQ